jgi:hypothetical protein
MILTRAALALAIATLVISPAPGKDRRQKQLEHMLLKLDPTTRLEQVCDAEAMKRIGKDHRKAYRPDRSVLSALSEPKVKGDTISGEGGAFRSRKKWYRYSFTCKATEDRLRVTDFEYKIGDEIPQTQWSRHGLYQ